MHGSTKSVQRPSTFYIEIIKNTGELLTASTRGLGGGGLCSYLHSGRQTRSPITR